MMEVKCLALYLVHRKFSKNVTLEEKSNYKLLTEKLEEPGCRG
jgi:hypothetical protein